jgi:putative glutamine transport system substrate-binding protein
MAKKLLAIALCFALALSFSACGAGPASTPPDDGGADAPPSASDASAPLLPVFRVGVKSDVPGFSRLDTETGEYVGFEDELAKLLAGELTGDPTKYTFTAVTAATRGPALDNNELDAIIATFTITDDRKLSYNFSTPYYEDAVGLLVKADSGYKSLADLDGKTIGVATSSTSQKAIEEGAATLSVAPKFQSFDTYPDIKAALDSGRVDAFSVDRSILSGYLDASTTLLEDRYSPQFYGVATKLSNTELAAKIDSLVQGWLADGTIQRLIAEAGVQ